MPTIRLFDINLLQMSLQAAILILVILILRACLLHRLPKQTFLALWVMAVARLLVPISISSPVSVFSLLQKGGGGAASQLTAISLTPGGFSAHSALAGPASHTVGSSFPLWPVWLIGCLGLAAYFTVTHLRCRREYEAALPVTDAFVLDWMLEHDPLGKVRVRYSDRIAAPLTYGIFFPILLLPSAMDWSDEARLEYILRHEMIHINRKDVLVKLALAAALCLHWFNPLVWVMVLLANRDIELACDEAVVRESGGREDYAMTLIGLEEEKSRFYPLCNNFSKHAIEDRVIAIMRMPHRSVLTVLLAVLLVSGTAVAFGTAGRENRDRPGYSRTVTYTYDNAAATEAREIILDEPALSTGPSAVTGIEIQEPFTWVEIMEDAYAAANETYYMEYTSQMMCMDDEAYRAYGLDLVDGRYYYQGEPVRFFFSSAWGIPDSLLYFDMNGTVDLMEVRDRSGAVIDVTPIELLADRFEPGV